MPFESRTSAILAALVLLAAPSLSNRSDAQQAPPQQPPSSEDVVFVGAGDIANCELLTGARATATLLDGIEGAVFTLGDHAYLRGTDSEFKRCYDPTWGRHKARTHPSPGNHDYLTAHAGQETYREISSCTNTEAFQARRANIKFREGGTGKAE